MDNRSSNIYITEGLEKSGEEETTRHIKERMFTAMKILLMIANAFI